MSNIFYYWIKYGIDTECDTMKWKSILDELPMNGSLVYVKTSKKSDELLCNYKNDSFGLGDFDFKIIKWRYAICEPRMFDLKLHYYNPLSILQADDHIDEHSLESSGSLGA